MNVATPSLTITWTLYIGNHAVRIVSLIALALRRGTQLVDAALRLRFCELGRLDSEIAVQLDSFQEQSLARRHMRLGSQADLPVQRRPPLRSLKR